MNESIVTIGRNMVMSRSVSNGIGRKVRVDINSYI